MTPRPFQRMLVAILLGLALAACTPAPESLDEVGAIGEFRSYLDDRPGVKESDADVEVYDENVGALRVEITFAEDATRDQVLEVLSDAIEYASEPGNYWDGPHEFPTIALNVAGTDRSVEADLGTEAYNGDIENDALAEQIATELLG